MLRFPGVGLTVSVDAPRIVYKGRPVRAVVGVRAHGAPLPWIVRAELGCENMLTGAMDFAPVSCAVSSRRGGVVDVNIESAHCGCVMFSVRHMRVYDALGLTYVKRRADVRGDCLVLPDIAAPDVVVGRQGLGKGDIEYSEVKPGYDLSETLCIREYAAGDSPKSVHWKLTGKFNKLMVREGGLPIENSALLLLETGAPAAPFPGPDARAAAAEAFISLSHSLLTSGVKHTVCWQDRNEETFVRLSLDSADDLQGALPRILSSGYGVDEIGCLRRYALNFGMAEQAHVVIVSAGGVYDDEECASLSIVTRLVSPSPEDLRVVVI
jgi:uncharacterized protein (DUF58 family)